MFTVLTPRQERFAVHFAEHHDLAEAYVNSYDAPLGRSRDYYAQQGRAVMNGRGVEARVKEIKDKAAEGTIGSIAQQISLALKAAFADVNELSCLRVGACRYCHGHNHQYFWTEQEYTRAITRWEQVGSKGKNPEPIPDIGGGIGFNANAEPHELCPECHGDGIPRPVMGDTTKLSPGAAILFQGVKVTRSGLEILIGNKLDFFKLALQLAGYLRPEGLNVNLNLDTINDQSFIGMDPNDAAKLYQEMLDYKPN